jgi:L-ascorbate metabolism protein UlaG (beta-lactamase superfamily)
MVEYGVMDIKYLGHSAFRIKGKSAVVVTDPFESAMVGLKMPVVDADIVTVSHEHADHNMISYVRPKTPDMLVIRGSGEYERNDVRIFGYQTYHDTQKGMERGGNTIYTIEIDGVRILHCGDLGHVLTDDILDAIDEIDIVCIPTGGFYTINEKDAAKVVHQIEPSIVIPMHYKQDGMVASFDQLSGVHAFIQEMDKEPRREQKLVISKDKMPSELTVVVLESA